MQKRHLWVGVACLAAAALGGCAAGRGPGGEVIVGLDVAKLPETTGQLLTAASGFLPPPFNLIATAGAGLLVAGGSAMAARARAAAAQVKVDAAFDEGHARASGVSLTPVVPAAPGAGPVAAVAAAPPAPVVTP